MKRKIFYVLIVLFSFFLETTILDKLEIFGVKPDLMLVLIVMLVLISRDLYAFTSACVFGVLCDFLFSVTFGKYLFIYTAICTLLIISKKYFFGINFKLAFLMFLVSGFLFDVLLYILSPQLYGDVSFFYILWRKTILTVLYGEFVLWIEYLIFKKLTDSFNEGY